MDMRELDRQALRMMRAVVTEEELEQGELQEAWQELQAVPAYVERFKDGRATFEDESLPSCALASEATQ